MKKLILIFAAISIAFLSACEPQQHKKVKHHKHISAKQKLHVIKVHPVKVDGTYDDSFLYYYWLFDSNTNNYYYTYSSVPTTNYKSLNWQEDDEKPDAISGPASSIIEEEPEVEINTSELGQEVVTEMATEYAELPAENSLDSMEGVPDSNTTSESSNSESSSPSSDGGSSGDSGGGGGDSGGGGGGD